MKRGSERSGSKMILRAGDRGNPRYAGFGGWDSERCARLVGLCWFRLLGTGRRVCSMGDFEICAIAARAGRLCRLVLVMNAALMCTNTNVARVHTGKPLTEW